MMDSSAAEGVANKVGQEGNGDASSAAEVKKKPSDAISLDQVLFMSGYASEPRGVFRQKKRMEDNMDFLLKDEKVNSTCSWFAIVEDDAYVNMTLVAEKLACLDPAKPRYLGSLYSTSDTPAYGKTLFVHGDMIVLSKPALARVVAANDRCQIGDGRNENSDVILAQCLVQYEKKEGLEKMRALQLFRVAHDNTHYNDSKEYEAAPIKLLQRFKKPQCLDVVHKVVGRQAMRAVHEHMQKFGGCPMKRERLFNSMSEAIRTEARSAVGKGEC